MDRDAVRGERCAVVSLQRVAKSIQPVQADVDPSDVFYATQLSVVPERSRAYLRRSPSREDREVVSPLEGCMGAQGST